MFRGVARLASRLSTGSKLTIAYGPAVTRKQQLILDQSIFSVRSSQQMSFVLKQRFSQLSDQDLVNLFKEAQIAEIPVDAHFKSHVLPLAREYIKVFSREHVESLGKIAISLASLGVTDANTWGLIEKRLVEEKLHRYLPVFDCVRLLDLLLRYKLGGLPLQLILADTIANHSKLIQQSELHLKMVKQMVPELERLDKERASLPSAQKLIS